MDPLLDTVEPDLRMHTRCFDGKDYLPVEKVESLRAEVASLKEERNALRRKIFTNTNREFTLENRTFSIEGDNFILDNNFDFDAGFNVSGDFGGDDKRKDYMQMICNALNSHIAITQQLAAANGRVERMLEALEPLAECYLPPEGFEHLGVTAHFKTEQIISAKAALSDLPEAAPIRDETHDFSDF